MKHEDISGTSDAGFRTRQLEAMRACHAGASWYDAYWYPEHRPQRAATTSRAPSMLRMVWNSWAALRPSERMVEPTLVLR
jgi:hypothetical protein